MVVNDTFLLNLTYVKKIIQHNFKYVERAKLPHRDCCRLKTRVLHVKYMMLLQWSFSFEEYSLAETYEDEGSLRWWK